MLFSAERASRGFNYSRFPIPYYGRGFAVLCSPPPLDDEPPDEREPPPELLDPPEPPDVLLRGVPALPLLPESFV